MNKFEIKNTFNYFVNINGFESNPVLRKTFAKYLVTNQNAFIEFHQISAYCKFNDKICNAMLHSATVFFDRYKRLPDQTVLEADMRNLDILLVTGPTKDEAISFAQSLGQTLTEGEMTECESLHKKLFQVHRSIENSATYIKNIHGDLKSSEQIFPRGTEYKIKNGHAEQKQIIRLNEDYSDALKKWTAPIGKNGSDGSLRYIIESVGKVIAPDGCGNKFDEAGLKLPSHKRYSPVRFQIEQVSLNRFSNVKDNSCGMATDAAGLYGLLLDFDGIPDCFHPDTMDFLKFLKALGLHFSYAVSSGGKGLHLPIIFDEPITNKEQAKRIGAAVYHALTAHAQVKKFELDHRPLLYETKYTVAIRIPGLLRIKSGMIQTEILPWQGRVSTVKVEEFLNINLPSWKDEDFSSKKWTSKLPKSTNTSEYGTSDGQKIEFEGKEFIIQPDRVLIVRGKQARIHTHLRLPIKKVIKILDYQGKPLDTLYSVAVGSATIEISIADSLDGKALATILNNNLGHKACISPVVAMELLNIEKHIASPDKEVRRSHNGYYNEAGQQIYLSGSLKISAEGVEESAQSLVHLRSDSDCKASHLGMKLLSVDRVKEVLQIGVLDGLLKLKDPSITTVAFASMLTPLISDLISEKPPTVIFYGASGTFKTTFLIYGMAMYGTFNSSNTLVSASSTANAIEKQGHYFRGAPFPVDDIKVNAIKNPHAFQTIFQNYYDGTGRDRLQQNLESRKAFQILGCPILTAEDHPWAGMESTAARTLVIDWSTGVGNIEASDMARSVQDDLRGVLVPFIQYLLKRGGNALKLRYRDLAHNGRDGLVNNQLRLFNNTLILQLVWNEFMDWLNYLNIDQQSNFAELKMAFTAGLKEIENDNLKYLESAKMGDIFLENLKELLANGQVRIENMDRRPDNHAAKVIGHYDYADKTNRVHLFPSVAVATVNELLRQNECPNKLAVASVGRDLRLMGFLEIGNEGNTKQKRINGKKTRTWDIDLTAIGFEKNTATKSLIESTGAKPFSFGDDVPPYRVPTTQ